MDVVGAEDVARAVRAVVGRALALGPALWRPAGSGGRAQADWSHLIEGDHDAAVGRRGAGEFQHARGLGRIVGVGTGLPGPGTLEGQAGLGEQAAEVRRTDLQHARGAQMVGQPRQRPARQRDPLVIGTSTGHRNRRSALLASDPAGTPAPILRVQRRHPTLVEVMDHAAHVRLVGHPHLSDLRHRSPDIRRQQDRRPLARGEVLGLLGSALKRDRLLMRQRPDEHLRGTHHHLPDRDVSPFATNNEFPAKPSEKGH